MPIYLDQQTRPTLERIINKWIESHPTDFVAERIKGSLEADAARLERMAKCQHTTARYVGEKTCCRNCESVYLPGMGESWTFDHELTDAEIKELADKVKIPEPKEKQLNLIG
jgi:hypothetical protein